MKSPSAYQLIRQLEQFIAGLEGVQAVSTTGDDERTDSASLSVAMEDGQSYDLLLRNRAPRPYRTLADEDATRS
jgi:hypothetical protein